MPLLTVALAAALATACRAPTTTLLTFSPRPTAEPTSVPTASQPETTPGPPSPDPSPTAAAQPTARPTVTPTPRPTATPKPTPRTVGLTEADRGTTVRVAVGDAIVLTLRECASCGSRWDYEAPRPDASVVEEVSDRREQGTAGSDARRTWTYRAVGAGTTEIRLLYVPPGDEPPTERYAVTVQVAR